MDRVTVHLLKPGKGELISYRGERLVSEPSHILIHARWERNALDLGFVTFETGDHFFEHYWTERWYNIFEIRAPSGKLKGWYCNVTRPAEFRGDTILSEDLELDLFVPPDLTNPVTLDEDEFAARAFDPATHQAALGALEDLKRMAKRLESPFDSSETELSLARASVDLSDE